ncbi:hypothetical protein QTN25_008721 [Entamoeba marina]
MNQTPQQHSIPDLVKKIDVNDTESFIETLNLICADIETHIYQPIDENTKNTLLDIVIPLLTNKRTQSKVVVNIFYVIQSLFKKYIQTTAARNDVVRVNFIVQKNLIPVILDIMTHGSLKKSIVAIQLLYKLFLARRDITDVLVEKGAIDSLKAMMNRNELNKEIVESIAKNFLDFAMTFPKDIKEDILFQLIPTQLLVIQNQLGDNQKNIQVISKICWGIALIAKTGKLSRNIQEIQLLPLLVPYLHSKNIEIQQAVVGIFSSLVVIDGGVDIFLQNQCFTNVIQLLESFIGVDLRRERLNLENEISKLSYQEEEHYSRLQLPNNETEKDFEIRKKELLVNECCLIVEEVLNKNSDSNTTFANKVLTIVFKLYPTVIDDIRQKLFIILLILLNNLSAPDLQVCCEIDELFPFLGKYTQPQDSGSSFLFLIVLSKIMLLGDSLSTNGINVYVDKLLTLNVNGLVEQMANTSGEKFMELAKCLSQTYFK